MSTAAIMLVKDEADIIEATLRHLAWHVDEILVADNESTDGTHEILRELGHELPLWITRDQEPGYWQSRKTTAMALDALARGHRWVVPCDADEIWYAPDGRRIADYLAGEAPDVHIVKARLYNHLPTAEDPPAVEEAAEQTGLPGDGPLLIARNPVECIGWRQRQHQALRKVACRLRESLVIHAGNHGASYQGPAPSVGGFVVRHYSWRSPEQYLRKIRNGREAYAATDLPQDTGTHWRMWEGHDDETIMEHFRKWFYVERPGEDETLIYDPAPLRKP